MSQTARRCLILPGWQNSGPSHWQSRWQARHGWERVEQADWHWPRRGDWMARLDEVVLQDPRPTALVAHSLGCLLVSAWAAHSAHTGRICAALLVAPADTERADTPPQLHQWRPIVRGRLSFPSRVIASSDDPCCDVDRSRELALDWGAGWVLAGPAGHLNGDSGLADWPFGETELHALLDPAGTSPAPQPLPSIERSTASRP